MVWNENICYIFILCGRNDAKVEEMYLSEHPKRRKPGRVMYKHLKDNRVSYGSFAKGKRNKTLEENKENLGIQSVVEHVPEHF